jgi:hypothetical protein
LSYQGRKAANDAPVIERMNELSCSIAPISACVFLDRDGRHECRAA